MNLQGTVNKDDFDGDDGGDGDPPGGKKNKNAKSKSYLSILNYSSNLAMFAGLFTYSAQFGAYLNSNNIWKYGTHLKSAATITAERNALALSWSSRWGTMGDYLSYTSVLIYTLKSRSAYQNNNNLEGLSNGLMGFYSIIAARGGLPGKVLTAPFFMIDATVGMDNFILHTRNYGIIQANQIQKGNWGVGIWRPGMGLK